jgi:hypothetical protein
MATTTDSRNAQRVERFRQAWRGAHGGAGRFFGSLFAFLTAYPPLAQGFYYLLLGVWPLVSLSTYQRLTGHGGDLPLAEVVGVLMLVIGGTLCLAAYRKQGSPEVLFLAFASAGGVVLLDIHFLSRGLSAVYLVDAVIEVGLVLFWVYGWRQSVRPATAAPAIPPGPAPRAEVPPPQT